MGSKMFLKLTKKPRRGGYRENFGQVRRYYPDKTGTQIEYMDGSIQKVEESAEQIDKMLGLNESNKGSVQR